MYNRLLRFCLRESLFLSLGVVLLSALTCSAMEETSVNKELIYTNHVKEKIQKRHMKEEEIAAIVRSGQRFLDKKYPDSILYKERSKKGPKQLVIVTAEPKDQPNKIIIITSYYANNISGTRKQNKYHMPIKDYSDNEPRNKKGNINKKYKRDRQN